MGVNGSVLVLNQNYEPLNICNTRRAFVLVSRGKAEVLEHSFEGSLRTPTREFQRPSVIRMIYLIKRPRPKVKLTRRELFLRDNYTCQYCGSHGKDLTLDHVVPRRLGGKHTWENLVSACRYCNHKKGGRSPEEAKMKLMRQPFQPKATNYYVLHQHLQHYVEWKKFIPEWELVGR
jgi:5-methylcytosine-specific restriction endonuclease McrA